MLPFEVSRYRGAGRDEHSRRVSVLVSRASRALKLPPATVSALETAAEMHHRWSLPLEEGPAEPDTKAAPLAWAIFEASTERGAPLPGVGFAAEVLSACNGLDEAAEFAAFEGASLREALTEFRETCLPLCSAPVAKALRAMIAPFPLDLAGARLPVLPRAASELIRTPEESVSPAQLARLAGSDPVLAGRLLGLANSSWYGSANPITRFTDAVLRVGVPMARKAMLAAAFAGLFASPALRELWQHSQSAAAAAHDLAQRAGLDPDTAWLSGLLHDVGRLAIETQSAAARVREMEWRKGGMPLDYAETLTFGSDHATLGAQLLRRWGLPEEIAEAVEFHHRPESAGSALAGVLALTEDWCAAGSGGESLSRGLRRMAAFRNTGLGTDALEQMDSGSVLFALAG